MQAIILIILISLSNIITIRQMECTNKARQPRALLFNDYKL
jgi:hypothetical protein